jgi:uncharacterized delta-60 repeat protein
VLVGGALLVAGLPGHSLAIPGQLDPGFDGDGKVITDSGQSEFGSAVAVQRDSKIVVAGGVSGAGGGLDFLVARYNADGTLDNTFGGGGLVATHFGEAAEAFGVAIQPGGRIVAAGQTETNDNFDFAIARYLPDGSLDRSFGGDGRVTTDFGAADQGFALALQRDGRIVVAGTSDVGGTNAFALARYNRDGSPDLTFGSGGRLVTDFGIKDEAFAIAVQTNGKIVAAGRVFAAATGGDFGLARYNANGSLDFTFGSGGKVTTDFGGDDSIHGVALQRNGKIVVAGGSDDAAGLSDFVVARYNSNGSLDPTFGSGGKVTTDFGGSDVAVALTIQRNGKIDVAGVADDFGKADYAVAQYNANGSLDPTFGSGGKVTTDFGSLDEASAVALQGKNRLVVAGTTGTIFGGRLDLAVARFLLK